MSDYKYTCVKCHVAFASGDLQREHFSSDWHRYNLKRNVADLPPVSAEAFRDRLLAQQAKVKDDEASTSTYCEDCKKPFGKQKAFDNHIRSKKHQDVVMKHKNDKPEKKSSKESKAEQNVEKEEEEKENDDDDDMEVEEVDSDEWEGEPILSTDCLFCNLHSISVIESINHMTEKHSFFVPDMDYCTNVEGLVTYLGEKVGCGMMCLWCNEKGRHFWSVDAVQKHMVDKGHTKMKLEGESLLEFEDFYDFSKSYPDFGKDVNPDEEVEDNQIPGDDFQLVLPSGAVIGHRSLNRYYKQKLDPNRQIVVKTSRSTLQSILSQYRALGWREGTVADVKRKHRDIKFMKRLDSRKKLNLAWKANKLQPHFRDRNTF